MQSNIFCKTMIPICPLRDEVLLFLSYGLRVLYEGFRRLLAPPCSPGCGSTEGSAGLSQRQSRKHFICKSTGSFVHPAGMREFRWRSTCCSCIHCNFHTITKWKTADFHSGRFCSSFAHKVKFCFGGFSSPTVDIINPIASWWQVRGFKARQDLSHIRGTW